MRSMSGLVLLMLSVACGGDSVSTDAVYRVRGKVEEVSGSANDRRATIAHEAIADFKDREGRVAGMPAMKMAFGIADQVDAKALVPGSQWQFTFAVRWKADPTLLITAAEPLPSDTKLALEP